MARRRAAKVDARRRAALKQQESLRAGSTPRVVPTSGAGATRQTRQQRIREIARHHERKNLAMKPVPVRRQFGRIARFTGWDQTVREWDRTLLQVQTVGRFLADPLGTKRRNRRKVTFLDLPTNKPRVSQPVEDSRQPNPPPTPRAGATCKPRPTDTRSKGGGSRAFVPYCERRR